MSNSLAPFVPSTPDMARQMLTIASVGKDDVVFDLGCGDGRILITAVKDFGVQRAVGYEMRRYLYERALQETKREELESRIMVVNEDLFEADISEATVITLFLTISGNSRLKPKLSEEAKAGTRIVSQDYQIAGWTHSKKERFSVNAIYLYKVPDAFS